jgi:hypothetical protein
MRKIKFGAIQKRQCRKQLQVKEDWYILKNGNFLSIYLVEMQHRSIIFNSYFFLLKIMANK